MDLVPFPITQDAIRMGAYASRRFAPSLVTIPAQYSAGENPWSAVASHLMWMGSEIIVRADAKPGVNSEEALLHVGAVLQAIDLTIEHREAAAAYLLDTWFTRIELTENVSAGVEAGIPA